jgi:hypothetical protein
MDVDIPLVIEAVELIHPFVCFVVGDERVDVALCEGLQ